MIRKLRAAQEKEEGFTLIELLVVVIIIGILAAIAIPSFLSQRERAHQADLTSAVRNVALEVEAEATAQNGDYSAVNNGAATTFADFVNAELTQLGVNTYITATTATATAGEFFLCMTTSRIDGPNNVSYDSDGGGLQDYAEAAC